MRIFLLAVWLVFLTMLSLSPVKYKFLMRTTGHWHKTGHWLAFFLATLLVCWVAKSVHGRLLGALGLLCVAFAQERLEQVGYHNVFEWWDVRTDFTGIVAGLALVFLIQRIYPENSKPQTSTRHAA